MTLAPRDSSIFLLMLGLTVTSGCCLGGQGATSGGATTGGIISLGPQSGASTVNATDPNPCEIDIAFGTVPVGLSDSVAVNVENGGPEPLTLAAEGTLDSAFTLAYDAHQPVAPGTSGQISVTFQPLGVGVVSSSFTIPTNDVNSACPASAGANGSLLTVKVTGTGINLSLVAQPGSLDLGSTCIGATVTNSLTLINKSTAPVTGITATLSGADADAFKVDDCPETLGAGDAATVNIAYMPLTPESRSTALLTFTGSDGDVATVTLFGEPTTTACGMTTGGTTGGTGGSGTGTGGSGTTGAGN